MRKKLDTKSDITQIAYQLELIQGTLSNMSKRPINQTNSDIVISEIVNSILTELEKIRNIINVGCTIIWFTGLFFILLDIYIEI
jgi:hypothetical protein